MMWRSPIFGRFPWLPLILWPALCLLLAPFVTAAAPQMAASASPAAKVPAKPSAADETLTFPDAHRLDNGLVTLAVSPRAGRAVWFGPTGGPNLLWINTPARLKNDPTGYHQFGGNKLWTTPQMMWAQAFHQEGSWPPEGVIDGRPWTLVEADRHHLVIESQVSPKLGLRARRSFELVPGQPVVRVVNTLTSVSANIFPSQIWIVTELPDPHYVLMGIAEDRPASARPWVSMTNPIKLGGRVTLMDHGRALRWDLPHEMWKIGTLGRWIAAVYDDLVLVQSTSFDAHGAYPEATNLQSWTGGNFTEIELLSASRHLQRGESMSQTMTWRLIPRRDRSAQQLVLAIRNALKLKMSDTAQADDSTDTK